jgi:hypothetical protein
MGDLFSAEECLMRTALKVWGYPVVPAIFVLFCGFVLQYHYHLRARQPLAFHLSC